MTRCTRRRRYQRTPGTSRRSSAAQAATRNSTAANQSGRLTVRNIGAAAIIAGGQFVPRGRVAATHLIGVVSTKEERKTGDDDANLSQAGPAAGRSPGLACAGNRLRPYDRQRDGGDPAADTGGGAGGCGGARPALRADAADSRAPGNAGPQQPA